MDRRPFILTEAKVTAIEIIDKDHVEIKLIAKRPSQMILGKVVNLEEHIEEIW